MTAPGRRRGMPLRRGVHRPLEDEATRLIMKSLEGVTSMEAKKDILTPWKEADRHRREILVASGFPDRSIRQGMYHRVWNSRQTHLNSRDGSAAVNRSRGALAVFVDERQHAGEQEE